MKVKKVFKSCLNYNHNEMYRSSTDLPSVTVPDQALTIAEIMKRYASGRPINVKNYDEYDDPANIDNVQGIPLSKLDISEVHDLMQTTATNLKNLQTEANRRLQEKKDEELEKSIIAKFKARSEAKTGDLEPVPAKFVQTTIKLPEDK